MTQINFKPVTAAVVLGILLEAGCGGTINLTKQKGSAGSESTLSAGMNSMLAGGSDSVLAGGSGSTLFGGAGSMTAAGAANSPAGGRGSDPLAGSGGGAGSPASGGILDPNRFGVVTRNACNNDSNPCPTDESITCLVRNTDSKNCGTCGHACSSGEICFAGVCTSPPAACGTDSMLAVPPPLAGGNLPQALVIGDWNGDGITDLAAANSNDGTVSVFLGCGGGTFAPRADYAVTAPAATNSFPGVELTSCDVNADAKIDLVTAGYADHAVTVLLGGGDGTFVVSGTSAFTGPGAVACADLSGDGYGDVAVCNNANIGSYQLSVLLSAGDGTLKSRVDFVTNSFAVGVAVGDLNEDGKADLVAGTADSVTALLGNGDGTFRRLPEQTNSAFYTNDYAIADLNGDGHLDLGVGDTEPRGGPRGGLGIIAGRGDGTFAGLVQLPPAIDIYGVATGDVNSDGKPDLVGAAQSGVRVMFGTAAGATPAESSVGLAITGYDVAEELGDMDGDGKLDLVFAKGSDNQIYLLVGNGDGTFRQ